MRSIVALAVLSVFAGVHQVAAVCGSGQMAIGNFMTTVFSGESSQSLWSGFLMDNNCHFISQSSSTPDYNWMCDAHDYNNGADVWCNNEVPVTARDTVGQWWNCWATNDGSCNRIYGTENIVVEACCSRQ